MKKEYKEFVCALHGYLIRIKEIHWNTDNNSTHKLCDDIENDVHSCEDRFAECVMGMEGKKFKIGDLMPLLPNAESLLPMLKELESDTLEMKKKCETAEKGGITNILDDILECCNKYKYRCTQS